MHFGEEMEGFEIYLLIIIDWFMKLIIEKKKKIRSFFIFKTYS